MNKFKKLFAVCAASVLSVACAFTFSACGLFGHEHSYGEWTVKTQATCDSDGVREQECSCGEVNSEPIPATGHDYQEEITSIPTEVSDGERTYTCRHCGNSYVEVIDASGFVLDSVPEFLASFIGDGTYSVYLEDGGSFSIIEEYTEYGETGSFVETYTLSLAEVALEVKQGYPTGYLNFEMSIGEEWEDNGFQNVLEAYLYLNGDNLFIETAVNESATEEEINVTDAIQSVIDAYMGEGLNLRDIFALAQLDYNQEFGAEVEALENALTEIYAFLQSDAIYDAINSVQGNWSAILELFDEEIIATEQGDGETVYSIDIQALISAVETASELTLSQLIDEIYGMGTFINVVNDVRGIPALTVQEIYELSVEYAQEYDVDVDVILNAISVMVESAMGEGAEFDIASEIEQNGNLSISALLAQSAGVEEEEMQSLLVAYIELGVSMAQSYSIDEVYNFITFGNPEYEYEGEVYSITQQIIAVLQSVEEITTGEITINDDGTVVDISLIYGGVLSVQYNFDEGIIDASVEVNVNGYTVEISAPDVDAQSGELQVQILDGEGETLYSGTASFDIENMVFSAIVNEIDQLLGSVEIDFGNNQFELDIPQIGNANIAYNQEEETFTLTANYLGYDVVAELALEYPETEPGEGVDGEDAIRPAYAIGGTLNVEISQDEEVLYSGTVALDVQEMSLESALYAADQLLYDLVISVAENVYSLEIPGVGEVDVVVSQEDGIYTVSGSYGEYDFTAQAEIGATDGEVEIAITQDGDEVYFGSVSVDGEEMSLSAVLREAGEVLAGLSSDTDIDDDTTFSSVAIRVGDYMINYSYSDAVEVADYGSFTFSVVQGNYQIVSIDVEYENGITTIDAGYGKDGTRVSLDGEITSEDEYSYYYSVETQEMATYVRYNVSRIDDTTWEIETITRTVDEFGSVETTETLIISLYQTDEAYGIDVSLDATGQYNEGDEWEAADADVSFIANRNEEGVIESLAVVVDCRNFTQSYRVYDIEGDEMELVYEEQTKYVANGTLVIDWE